MRVQTLAEAFVDELDRCWVGRQVDDEVPPVVYRGAAPLSLPAESPPRLRFESLLDSRPWYWQKRFDFPDLASDPDAAADLFASVAFENLTEWRIPGSPPAGLAAPARDVVG
ncbi:MAG: hypothetical protein E6J41_20335 [Chloroflexi bacterium]|nr:MAG: hypothetical protein E6J41_20335 [Chloroflexota bacterium]